MFLPLKSSTRLKEQKSDLNTFIFNTDSTPKSKKKKKSPNLKIAKIIDFLGKKLAFLSQEIFELPFQF